MTDTHTFRVVGVQHCGGEQALLDWTQGTGGSVTIGNHWSWRVVLNPVPVRALGAPICDLEGREVWGPGTAIDAIRLEPEELYRFPNKIQSGAQITADLADFRNAIQVILHIQGDRRQVGWVPASIAGQLIDRLDQFYVQTARIRHGQLEITVRQRKNAAE
jgi:hypothetical protein